MPKPRKKPPKVIQEEANMTPMIDVTFLLLIFFILNLKFKKEESNIRAWLPKNKGFASKPKPDEVPLDEIRINLRHKKEDPIDTPTRFRVNSEQFNTLAEVRNRMSQFANKDRPVVIDAQYWVKFGDVVKVLDMCQQLEFKEVNFTAPHWFSPHAKFGYEPVSGSAD